MNPFDLERFAIAHKRDFETALAEIRSGRKQTHWMWYIFPQLAGLGFSYTAQYFEIPNLDAARAFLADPYLRNNLITITHAFLELEETNPERILGFPDDRKLQSSMTLFELAAPDIPVFGAVLEKFYSGHRDEMTLSLLDRQKN